MHCCCENWGITIDPKCWHIALYQLRMSIFDL